MELRPRKPGPSKKLTGQSSKPNIRSKKENIKLGRTTMDFDDYKSSLPQDKTELLDAVETGTLAEVQELLNSRQNSDQYDDFFNYILVVTALRRKHKAMAKFFIKEKFPLKITERTGFYNTPLYYAVNIGDVEIFRALWKNGACIFDKDANDDTPLELAMVQSENKIIESMIVCVLNDIRLGKKSINLKPDNEEHLALFHAACLCGNDKAMKFFVSRYFHLSSHSGFNNERWKGFTPLHFVLSRSHNLSYAVLDIFYKPRCSPRRLREDVDPFAIDDQRITPVHLALRNGHVDFKNEIMIERIRACDGTEPTNLVDGNGLSYFHIACSIRHSQKDDAVHVKYIENLINSGIDVNSSVSMDDEKLPGYTALHFAIEGSSWSVFKLLLDSGVNSNIADKNGITPLHLICKARGIECEQRLKIVKQLLDRDADPFAKTLEDCTPLHMSFWSRSEINGLDEIEVLLLSKNQEGINHTDKYGLSYLHIACMGNDLDTVKILIANGASINACIMESPQKDYNGYSALHFAVELKKIETVECLLVHEADPNSCTSEKITPLHLACVHNFNKIQDRGNANDGKVDWILSQAGHVELITLLIKYGASVNAEDSSGSTLLKNCLIPKNLSNSLYYLKQTRKILASIQNELLVRQKMVMNLLLSHGADINATSNCEGSILHILIKNVVDTPLNHELIRFALEKEADVNAVEKSKHFTPLHLAVGLSIETNRRLSLVSLLLEFRADINAKSNNGDTPLHVAAGPSFHFYGAKVEIVKKLLDHSDICVDAQNCRGQTPLHVAIVNTNLTSTKYLVDYGADFNYVDVNGRTPMSYLSMFFHGSLERWPKEKQDLVSYVIKHVKKLMILKFYVSEQVQKEFEILVSLLPPDDLIMMDTRIDEELEILRSRKLDNYNSLYDILFKDSNSMAKHTHNDELRSTIMSTTSEMELPLFHSFLRRRYQEGCRRSSVLEPAIRALDSVLNVNWPHLCSELILSFLSHDDLRNIIQSASIKKLSKRGVGNAPEEEVIPSKVPRFGK